MGFAKPFHYFVLDFSKFQDLSDPKLENMRAYKTDNKWNYCKTSMTFYFGP